MRASSSANVDALSLPGMPEKMEWVLEGMVPADESSLPGASLLGGVAVVGVLSGASLFELLAPKLGIGNGPC
jgi:hypothetical protein